MQSDSEKLRSIIEVSHVEFQSYDFQRHQLICSSGLAEKVLGYSAEEYFELSRNFYEELVHPDDLQKTHKNIEKLIHSQKGEIVENTARYRRSDGNYLWLYTRKIVSERDEKGDPSIITTVAEDITEVLLLQEQLREKVALLESISFRNSHLVRSPVASIIGLINLIEEKDIASEHNMQIFNFLKQAIEKLDAVIHEINDLSQV